MYVYACGWLNTIHVSYYSDWNDWNTFYFILFNYANQNTFLFYNDGLPRPNHPLTRTTLGQLCAALWHSQSRPGWDTARDRTRVCSDASSTEMQYLTPLRHSGAPTLKELQLVSEWVAGRASRVAQLLRALYCSASCAIRVPGFAPRLCRNRPRPGGPWGDA